MEKILGLDKPENKAGTRAEGQNLIAVINGQEFVRQTNSFAHEGMTYTFHSTFNTETVGDSFRYETGPKAGQIRIGDEKPISIEVNKNNTEIIDSVKSFVEEYNKIITQLNDLLTQKKDKDYRPLSDDEKKAMKEDDIKAYEERAKMGILANDPELRRLLDQMRSAIYQKVEGVGITMSDIGITTSPNWKDGGLLVIDETKLNKALNDKYDDVVALFSKASSIPATDTAKAGRRASESGIAQRLNDIFNAAVGTIGQKGYLVLKAGTVNDATQYDNTIQKQINQYDKRISELLERWQRQESSYYKMFARMETAMSKMISQQNNLASLMAQQGG